MEDNIFNKVNKVKKKIIGTFLAGLLSSSLLQAAPERDIEAVLTVTQNATEPTIHATEAAIDRFKIKYPNVTIRTQYVPQADGAGGWGEYNNAFLNQVAAGQAPDIVYSAIEGFSEMAASGVLLNLDDQIKKDPTAGNLIDGIDSNLLENIRTRATGEFNFFPKEWNNVIMFYNKDMFDAAGLDYPNADWTWDEYAEAASALTLRDDRGNVTQYGTIVPGFAFGLMPWLFTNDASILDEEWKNSTVDTKEFRESLQFLHDLIYKYEAAPAFEAGVGTEKFTAKQVAMFAAGRWPATPIKESGMLNVGVQYMPHKTRSVTVFGIGGLAITKQSQHPELAWELIKEMTGDEYQQYMADIGASIPSARKYAVAESFVSWPDNSEIFYESAATAIPMTAPTNFAQVSTIFERNLATYFNNEVDLETTIASMDRELDRAMRRANR